MKRFMLISCVLCLCLIVVTNVSSNFNKPLSLVEKGRKIFFNETFNGNGRTCGTCHPAENNFTIDPAFIATLPPNDPLFVAEFVPALMQNFENPTLMREFGLILENVDGFDDLANKFVMRGVPQTLSLRTTSVSTQEGNRLGWSGDGAPNDGSLRSFAIGAVRQHFTKTLARVEGVDFRLPTNEELNALEAFQLSLGRQANLVLPLPLKGIEAQLGQDFFLNSKCNNCHTNAGAGDNRNFNTGVENLLDKSQDETGELIPPDDGFGTPGDGEFNTPPLVEAADTGPFFHDNSIGTLEAAIAFFAGPAFDGSPSGPAISMDGTQVANVAAFLRVLNSLENIQQSIDYLSQVSSVVHKPVFNRNIDPILLAKNETKDAIKVLVCANLHFVAVKYLNKALALIKNAENSRFFQVKLAREAIKQLENARFELVEPNGA